MFNSSCKENVRLALETTIQLRSYVTRDILVFSVRDRRQEPSSWVNRNQSSYSKPSVINFYFIIFMPIEIKNAGPIKLLMPNNTNSGIIVVTLLGSIERIV